MDSVMVDMVHVQAIDGRAPPGGRPPPAVAGRPHPQMPDRPSGWPGLVRRGGWGSAGGDLAAVEELLEPGPGDDGDAQLLGLLELGGAGLGAEHHGPGPGRDAPG